MLFEDRTRAHADHIGQGFERRTTAAVGVLKAVRAGDRYGVMRLLGTRRSAKDVSKSVLPRFQLGASSCNQRRCVFPRY